VPQVENPGPESATWCAQVGVRAGTETASVATFSTLATVGATKKVGSPLAFYSAAATVIPVLFLALVYQTRYLRRPESHHRWLPLFQSWVAVSAMLVAAAGEVAALHVLETQTPTLKDQHTVAITLILFGTAVVIEPVVAALQDLRDEDEGPDIALGVIVACLWAFAGIGIATVLH
jgi:hypothetical protein